MPDPQHIAIILAVLNSLAFMLYGMDKLLAKTQSRRIPEKVLITFSALFASPGAILGMVIFNHKTSKPKFRYGAPSLLIIHATAAYWISFG